MYFTTLLKKETLKMEDIKYYFDKKWGLFKKIGFDEYYFSRKRLDWIECQIVFILPAWDYQCVITSEAAEKIIEEYKTAGNLEDEVTPYRFFANDNDFVYAEDILRNQFYVEADLKLKPAPMGTVDCMWGCVSEEEAAEYVKRYKQ